MNEVLIRTDFSMEIYSEPHNYIARFEPKEVKAIERFLDIIGFNCGEISIEPFTNTTIVEDWYVKY